MGELNSLNLGSLKDEESGGVALYHYLKNLYEEATLVTPELINHFFADALQLPHWQEKRLELYRDIIELLQRFYSQPGTTFQFNSLWDLSRFQMILVSQAENLFAITQNYEQASLKEGEKIRIMMDTLAGRSISVKRLYNGELIIRTFNNLARVAGHVLMPLGPDQELFYDANLELKIQVTQLLRTAPHSQVRFNVGRDQIDIQFISGFAFRQSQLLKIKAISQEPRIFYPLKRLERFYIQRSTDPYYVELISTLDKAIELMGTRTAEALSFAQQAFEGGQIAFDQIFPDDKALYIRLRELAKLVSIQPRTVTSNSEYIESPSAPV